MSVRRRTGSMISETCCSRHARTEADEIHVDLVLAVARFFGKEVGGFRVPKSAPICIRSSVVERGSEKPSVGSSILPGCANFTHGYASGQSSVTVNHVLTGSEVRIHPPWTNSCASRPTAGVTCLRNTVVRVRIPGRIPTRPRSPTAEARASNPRQWEFESPRGYHTTICLCSPN